MNMEDWQAQIWDCPNMNPTAVAICLAIGSHGHWSQDKTVWASKQRIASMVGTSRDNVGKYMTALEEQGWLKVVAIHKNNKKEFELCKPQVVVVYGILAIKQRGSTAGLKNQVVVDDGLGCRSYGSQVVVDNGQVVVNYDTNLPRTYQENFQEELTKTSTGPSDAVQVDEDERLGEEAIINRVEQVNSYIQGVRYLSLTSEQKAQIRELTLNPQWYGTESRPNHRTQAAIKEVVGNE